VRVTKVAGLHGFSPNEAHFSIELNNRRIGDNNQRHTSFNISLAASGDFFIQTDVIQLDLIERLSND
jgi:hypothetical protein